jgi:hypothetical protein
MPVNNFLLLDFIFIKTVYTILVHTHTHTHKCKVSKTTRQV